MDDARIDAGSSSVLRTSDPNVLGERGTMLYLKTGWTDDEPRIPALP
ncbi:hypothetical protein ACQEU3_10250 [Spirillospora sp. CA-253888]